MNPEIEGLRRHFRRARCWLSVAGTFGLAMVAAAAGTGNFPANPTGWNAITRESRPWTYNWWMGSAVDTTNLTRELQRYKDAGLGGIHIIPIYAAKGPKARRIDFLSPKWMDTLRFCIQEAGKLDLGVDMTTGTGWCFGGPNVPTEQGGWKLETRAVNLKPGEAVTEKIEAGRLLALIVENHDGQCKELRVALGNSGELNWTPESDAAKLWILSAFPGGPEVKRAAPGGMGLMINPFDPAAMTNYLARFTDAFDGYHGPVPRSMYHDSYEYNSSWSPQLLVEFARRRGYRLQDQWAALCEDPGKNEDAARIRADFKETLSDLMVEEVFPEWVDWCHKRGMMTRYQAHGSPANLLDLYALADVPETEMFGRGTRDPLNSEFDSHFGEGDRSPLVSKFASSAAHVSGHPLVSSETGTWMAEHFCETLEEMKCLVDLLLVSGINHIFYHGTCYSPDDVKWPGWVFYAATEMNPRNAIWHDVPALNEYIARCQAILQSGRPDNDVLLYWPIHDYWESGSALVTGLAVHNRAWLEGQPVGVAADFLWQHGYGFDYVSDRWLQKAEVGSGGGIVMSNSEYRCIVAPATQLMPEATMRKLLALARSGANVIFEKRLPEDVPGWGELAARRSAFHALIQPLASQAVSNAPFSFGNGRVFIGETGDGLRAFKVERESIADNPGVHLIRRRHDKGRHYFIANQGTQTLEGWFRLGTPAKSVVALDALSGRTGVLASRAGADGSPEVPLRLEPGQSIVLRTFEQKKVSGPKWQWERPAAAVLELRGPWQVEFGNGGPEHPDKCEMSVLKSWTLDGDPKAEAFAGSAVYRTTFDRPAGRGPWLLDLGRVCHSARVRLNGKDLGTVFMEPYRVPVEKLRRKGNRLEVEVTNLSANRIRDLDRRKVPWRLFYFVNFHYHDFDASNWPVFDSGLMGSVRLMSCEEKVW